jgi:hypothetical protein
MAMSTKNALVKPSSNCKLQTNPFIREGAQNKKTAMSANKFCGKERKIVVMSPR